MNEHTLHDPQLQSLEARLAASPLQLPAGEQQQLLYQCAFAAGKKTSTRSLRRWQAAAALLAVLLLGMSVPLARDEWLLATQRATPTAPTEPTPGLAESAPPPARMMAQELTPHRAPKLAAVNLDAWQLLTSKENSLTEELARLEKTEPQLRSLTVGTLTRSVLNP